MDMTNYFFGLLVIALKKFGIGGTAVDLVTSEKRK